MTGGVLYHKVNRHGKGIFSYGREGADLLQQHTFKLFSGRVTMGVEDPPPGMRSFKAQGQLCPFLIERPHPRR